MLPGRSPEGDTARQACLTFPGKYKNIHWDLEDSAQATGSEEEKLVTFRKIRDKIQDNISEFLTTKS